MQPRKLYVNTATRTISDNDRGLAGAAFAAFSEDIEGIELYFIEPQAEGGVKYLDYSANTVKLAVGVTAPAAIITGWSALPTTVTATITSTQAGGSGNNEVQTINLSPSPRTGSYSIQFPSRTVTVSSITASTCLATNHGFLNGQSISLTGFSGTPSGFSNGDSFFVRDRTSGSFRLSTTPVGLAVAITATSAGAAVLGAVNTPLIRAGAAPTDVQAAIAGAGLAQSGQSQVGVTGSANELTLTYGGALSDINFANVTLVNNTLAGAAGLTANLSFNTVEMDALLAAGNGESCILEIEVAGSGKRQTFQIPASVRNDIIASTSPTPIPATTSFNLQDSAGDTWNITIDTNGVLTATKQ